MGTIGQLIGTPVALACIAVALVTFPDGNFLTARWRLLPIAGIAAVAAFALAAGLGSPYVPYFPGVPNPYFVPEVPTAVFVGLRLISAAIGLVLVIVPPSRSCSAIAVPTTNSANSSVGSPTRL